MITLNTKSKINKPSVYADNKSSAEKLWDMSVTILKNKGLTL